MNFYFLFAGILAVIVGLVHSFLGERWVFKRMRQGGVVPINGGTVLREPHVRILWASWHVVTVLGWCIACLLIRFATLPDAVIREHFAWFILAIAVAMLVSAAIVFFATKGKHVGWVGLLTVALFTLVGLYR